MAPILLVQSRNISRAEEREKLMLNFTVTLQNLKLKHFEKMLDAA